MQSKEELPPIEPPDPAGFTRRGARQLAWSIYRYVQQSMNRAQIGLSMDPIPDRFPVSKKLISAMVAASDESIRDLGQVLQLLSDNQPLEADELYRDWHGRMRERNLKNHKKQLALFAAKQKSLQTNERKRLVAELADDKRARRPNRSKRALALDIAPTIGRSEETVRKYLRQPRHKHKKQ